MSNYPELKSSAIVFEDSKKSEAMYPPLATDKDLPPAYTEQPIVAVNGAPPTICTQCTQAIVTPVVAPPNTTVVQSSDFCRRCCRAKRRMLRRLIRGRFCECRVCRCCK